MLQLGKDRDFSVHVVDTVLLDGVRVGNGLIREYLQTGNLNLAQRYLGRPFSLTGRVIYGDQRGREWGFPTINVPLFRHRSPVTGIFAVHVEGDGFSKQGVASIGYRPVFKLRTPLLEVFIFDFNQEVYGQRVTVTFLKNYVKRWTLLVLSLD